MRITLDWNGPEDVPPEAGDVLATTRSAYRVLTVRQVRSRVHPSRWALGVERVDRAEVLDFNGDTRVIEFRWHPRGRRR